MADLISDIGIVESGYFTKDEEQLCMGCSSFYQPIVNAFSEEVFGYTGFLNPTFCSVYSLITQLKEDRQLHLLEKITRYVVLSNYKDTNYPLFVKTIPTENLTDFERNFIHTVFDSKNIKMIMDIVEFSELSLINLRQKQRAYPLSICNFGQGIWNSGRILNVLKPSYLKIGYRFTYNIHKDTYKQKDFIALKEFIESKNIVVIATEIENAADYNYLKSIGVKYMSGYYVDELLSPKTDKSTYMSISDRLLKGCV